MVVSQFCSDSAVNSLLNYSKCVVDQICGNYERPRELRSIQYLIFAGMISYYGFNHIEEITAAFKKNKFFYTRESVADFLRRQKDVSEETLRILDKDDTCAFFHQNYFHKKATNEYFSEGKIVVSDKKHYAPDMLLEYTAHEVNHAVNSVMKSIVPIGNSFRTRMGLYTKDHRTGSMKNRLLEESINTLQTADLVEHILQFTYYDIEDREIRYALDSLKYAAGYKRNGISYALTIPIVRPLYENGRFQNILKERRIDGNVSVITSEFDAKAGKESFDTLGRCLDNIYATGNGSFYSSSQHQAESLVKRYVKK